jgi:hypothetical protein
MNYCNKCEIAYDERFCPLCEAKEKIKRLEKYNEELFNRVEELESDK